jgi:hypothetical protein
MEIDKLKITKTNVNKIISWSKTRYNDWLGYGTKKEAVNKIYKALKDGIGEVFIVQCASPAGESYNGRFSYWKTKSAGGKYEVDPVRRTIKNMYSGEVITFEI